VEAADQYCRDEALVPAPPAQVWEALTDLSTWSQWWTLVSVVPLGGTAVAPGVRFRFEGQRAGRPPTVWTVEVLEVEPLRRIELAYVDGDLVGRAAWEIETADGGTNTAEASGETFARYGTRLHSVAMHVDALDGLARYVRGEPLDEGWRETVRERMNAGVAALG